MSLLRELFEMKESSSPTPQEIFEKTKELCKLLTTPRHSMIRDVEVYFNTIIISVYAEFPEHYLKIAEVKPHIKPFFTRVGREQLMRDVRDGSCTYFFHLAHSLSDDEAEALEKEMKRRLVHSQFKTPNMDVSQLIDPQSPGADNLIKKAKKAIKPKKSDLE